ncbi:NifU family protein [Streptomyces actuosus]|uniref:NifU family protein n=1 Tax=Streptomyces actuosus TaxID=1885 RepID=A0ABS2VIC0_STRAS|nr:NifU family protein [Streptomyces actuosus]MBN0042828.1 NifU family protein [Streptomyces actuosus]
MADAERLDDTAVSARLARIDDLLERLENSPGPTARDAVQAVRDLTDVYGEALARVVDRADPALAEALADDDLIGHLLILHDVHPEPLLPRLERAVGRLRDELRRHGGDIELAGVDEGVARVRLTAGGCGSAASGVLDAVRERLLAVAPELDDVRREPDAGQGVAFVPLDALTRPAAQPQGAP